MPSARAGPSRSRSLPAPSNLQSWQSSIPSGKEMPVRRGPGCGRAGPDLLRRAGQRGAQRSSLRVSRRPSKLASGARKRPRMPLPPDYHRADPLDSTIQTERESECTSFVCRGRRTVEQRKKNKLSLALSAVSWGSLLPSSKGGPAALFSFPAAPLRL